MSDKPKTAKQIARDLVAQCREELSADAVVLIITGSRGRKTYTQHFMSGNVHACRGALADVFEAECEPVPEEEEADDEEEEDAEDNPDQRPEIQ